MAWFQDFLASIEDRESPKSYFYWSILTAISAVVARRLWVNRGGVYLLYPNVYTFLISKKSGLRKGIPVDIAKSLAHLSGTVRVIDGQNSIQGVLKDLSQIKTLSSGHVIKNAEGFLITGEFASFMLSDGIGFSLTTLTDLYDSHYHGHGFTKRLSTQDELVLKQPCLTALFASNETHFFDAVPKNAISGGFLARTFCVYEEKRTNINSLTGVKKPVPKKVDLQVILNNLKRFSTLEGEISVDPKAAQAFDDWYYSFSEKEQEWDDETGTSERIGDNIWKAAMLIGLANNNDQFIMQKDMEEAIFQGMKTLNNIKRLLLGGTADAKSIKSITMRTMIAMMIETEPLFEVERKLVLRRGSGVFGVYDLDETIEHLIQAGMIKQEKRGSGTYYKMTKVIIDRHMKNKGGNEGYVN